MGYLFRFMVVGLTDHQIDNKIVFAEPHIRSPGYLCERSSGEAVQRSVRPDDALSQHCRLVGRQVHRVAGGGRRRLSAADYRSGEYRQEFAFQAAEVSNLAFTRLM